MFENYPLIIAANRDEHYDRPSAPPALLNTQPKIIAGRDLRAGGTWLGVNETGLIAGILNRRLDGQQGIPSGVHVFSSAAEFEMYSAKADRAYALFAKLSARVRPTNGKVLESIAALQTVL